MTEPAILVIDTSVAVKWYVPESGAEAAVALLTSSDGRLLISPDLIGPELGNVLWKKVRRGELDEVEARTIVDAFAKTPPVQIVPSAPYLPAAFEIATRHDRTVYDSLYLALAVARGGHYITADDRLVRALSTTTLAPVLVQL